MAEDFFTFKKRTRERFAIVERRIRSVRVRVGVAEDRLDGHEHRIQRSEENIKDLKIATSALQRIEARVVEGDPGHARQKASAKRRR